MDSDLWDMATAGGSTIYCIGYHIEFAMQPNDQTLFGIAPRLHRDEKAERFRSDSL